ncbi:unnamed protein product, partial [Mesorhabditis spiculigera]
MILGAMGLVGCFLGIQGIRLKEKSNLKWAFIVLSIMFGFAAAGCLAIVFVFGETDFLFRLAMCAWLALILLIVWKNKKALDRCDKCY